MLESFSLIFLSNPSNRSEAAAALGQRQGTTHIHAVALGQRQGAIHMHAAAANCCALTTQYCTHITVVHSHYITLQQCTHITVVHAQPSMPIHTLYTIRWHATLPALDRTMQHTHMQLLHLIRSARESSLIAVVCSLPSSSERTLWGFALLDKPTKLV